MRYTTVVQGSGPSACDAQGSSKNWEFLFEIPIVKDFGVYISGAVRSFWEIEGL